MPKDALNWLGFKSSWNVHMLKPTRDTLPNFFFECEIQLVYIGFWQFCFPLLFLVSGKGARLSFRILKRLVYSHGRVWTFDVITSSLKFSFRHDCQYKLSLLNRWFRKFPRGRWIINNEICASSKPFMLIPWPCWPGGRNARKNSSQTSLKIWGPFPTRYILVALCTCREKTSISFGRGSWWNHSSMRLNYSRALDQI